MRLAELIESVPAAYRAVRVKRVVADSREAGPGALFVARTGTTVDGHAFIAAAARAGCSAVVGSHDLPPGAASLLRQRGVPYVRVTDSAEALGQAGTNGKRTVATLLYELFTGGVARQRAAVVGAHDRRRANPREDEESEPA